MKKKVNWGTRFFAVAMGICAAVQVSGLAAVAQPETTNVVKAADAFLATLDGGQKKRVQFAFGDKEQQARWSNFPVKFVPRAGLSLQELSPTQQQAAMALVASVLSPQGFEKVQEIRGADDDFGRDHGKGLFGRDLYYISLLGAPSDTAPWMLQFGGHHLALNITMRGGKGVLTPTLTGTQPATYTLNGKTIRPLGRENDKAFALMGALDLTQRKKAVLTYEVPDLVLGPGHDGETIPPEGLEVSAMTDKQKDMLIDLVSEWSGIVNEKFAAARLAQIKAELPQTYFAWSGSTTVEPGKNGASYYRIQGPHLVIEYAPQHNEDHVHTIYRDPSNDYGKALVQ